MTKCKFYLHFASAKNRKWHGDKSGISKSLNSIAKCNRLARIFAKCGMRLC